MRLTLTIALVTQNPDAANEVKEALAMTLERWGDAKLLQVESAPDFEQLTIAEARTMQVIRRDV